MLQKFKDLKKQILEELKNFESRLLESNIFNLLKERYQSLNLLQKKLVRYTPFLILFLILISIPLSYFFSSVSYWREFKEKQNISLNLLKLRKNSSSFAFRYSQDQLNSRIKSIVEKYSTEGFKVKDKKKRLPKGNSIYEINFEIQVDYLNVKQVVRLGVELSNLSQSRLSSLTMLENEKFPKHYDVIYKVSSFVLKEKKASSSRNKEKSLSEKRKSKRKRKKKEESLKAPKKDLSKKRVPELRKENQESATKNKFK